MAEWIKEQLIEISEGHKYSRYLNVWVEEETEDYWFSRQIKIRVSNHGARSKNTRDGEYVLSFVTKRTAQMDNILGQEWEMEDIDTLLTDTFEYVEDILEWEFENVNLIKQ